jgi:predicted nuclease with TOPRIM domain
MTPEEQNELLSNYEKLLAAHSEMTEKYNDYQAENLLLNENYENLRAEYIVVIKTVIKTLQTVGIWPITDKIEVKTLVKTVSSLALDSMLPGGSNIKERFAFITDILPIAAKYKDIDINTLE